MKNGGEFRLSATLKFCQKRYRPPVEIWVVYWVLRRIYPVYTGSVPSPARHWQQELSCLRPSQATLLHTQAKHGAKPVHSRHTLFVEKIALLKKIYDIRMFYMFRKDYKLDFTVLTLSVFVPSPGSTKIIILSVLVQVLKVKLSKRKLSKWSKVEIIRGENWTVLPPNWLFQIQVMANKQHIYFG